jgi:hypothetical protein
MLAGELPKREDLAKLALDRGQISQETYNRMVPPVDPTVPKVELTDYLPKSVPDVMNRVMPGTGSMLADIKEGAKSMLGMNEGVAEVPLRNPALDEPVQAETFQAPDYLAPQSGQASQVAPNPMAGLSGAFEKQKQAIMKAAEMGAAQAASESAYQQKVFDESEKMRQDQALIDQNRQAKLFEYESQLNQKMDEYAKRPANIGQVFSNAGTGQKILMGLALFLGAAPNSTGQNKAVTAMQNAIDSDLAKAKAEVGDRKSAYQEMKETFKDDRQADAAARLAYLNNAQIKLNQIAAQYKGPQILENAKLLNAKIDEEKEKQKMQFMAAAQVNPVFQQADELTQKILQLPKDLRDKALKEKADLDAVNQQTKQLDRLYDEIANQQTLSNRVTNPIQSRSLIKKAEADLFPIVKAIVGERMTDSDAKMLIAPQLPNFTDDEKTIQKKKNDLMSALKAKATGSTPILSGFGLLPQESDLERRKQGYVKTIETKGSK